MNIIELKEIHKKYNIGKPTEVHALKGINISIKEAEMLSIIGTSGSGKSTLLHILGCLDKSTSGTYYLNGEDVNEKSNKEIAQIRNKKMGFVLQDFGLILNKSVVENVSYPLLFSDIKLINIKKTCIHKLDMIGIADLAKRQVNELSGGQKQRVAIARALVNDPDIILADEPTGSLDSGTSTEILKIFKSLNELGKAIILVTHDNNIANVCGRKICIEDGTISD